ncbi:MAG: sterol desaturase family protein, partial [Sandaracinobacteroides sp.]
MQTMLFTAFAMCLIVMLRYLAVSGLFAWTARRVRPDIYAPADPRKAARLAKQIRREIGWSLLAAIIYGLPSGVVAHLWVTQGATRIYAD